MHDGEGKGPVTEEVRISGVYYLDADGDLTLVHAYTDDDYELADIVELFALGEMESASVPPGAAFSIARADLRRLKVHADAESFDHPEGFIEMCLDIYRFGDETAGDPLRFVSLA
jgi:hypothetical protein